MDVEAELLDSMEKEELETQIKQRIASFHGFLTREVALRLIAKEKHRIEKGKAIILTTHVMDEAEKCDRLILIRAGRIIRDGTPEELKKQTPEGTLEAIFIRSAKQEWGGVDH